jgi:hypothetical protein
VTKEKPRNLAASVRQRLLNLSRTRGEDFQFVFTRYALERFLYRLSQSEHRDVFVLKGAMLFQLWGDQPTDLPKVNDSFGYLARQVSNVRCPLCRQADRPQFLSGETSKIGWRQSIRPVEFSQSPLDGSSRTSRDLLKDDGADEHTETVTLEPLNFYP